MRMAPARLMETVEISFRNHDILSILQLTVNHASLHCGLCKHRWKEKFHLELLVITAPRSKCLRSRISVCRFWTGPFRPPLVERTQCENWRLWFNLYQSSAYEAIPGTNVSSVIRERRTQNWMKLLQTMTSKRLEWMLTEQGSDSFHSIASTSTSSLRLHMTLSLLPYITIRTVWLERRGMVGQSVSVAPIIPGIAPNDIDLRSSITKMDDLHMRKLNQKTIAVYALVTFEAIAMSLNRTCPFLYTFEVNQLLKILESPENLCIQILTSHWTIRFTVHSPIPGLCWTGFRHERTSFNYGIALTALTYFQQVTFWL